ncbi:MAG TPA: copper-containing nitrite reductase [Flavobacteriaceae bacterium]|nr:copper-containing nitrite reductase [Flavobacteriaceae bacterium]
MSKKSNHKKYSRKQFMRNAGGAIIGGSLLSSFGLPKMEGKNFKKPYNPVSKSQIAALSVAQRVAADPRDIPPPITRKTSKTVHVELECVELVSELEDGTNFHYMTFGGTVPGPMIRVRLGDTVIFTLTSSDENLMLHNIDFHAVYGTGGGADATYVTPGSEETIKFKALYPGAFIYHCAVPAMDQHISSGMFGIILVEPEEGLPKVDHEFYLGQHEVYIQGETGDKGLQEFSFDKMKDEDADYVLLNGQKGALTDNGYGAMRVKKGETARIFFVNGGPNLASSFHPIGNVWTKAWRDGALASSPERYVQTMLVPPGDCAVFEMDFPVPSTIHLVDHALSRVEYKGMLADIVVEGSPELDIYDPNYEV